MTDMQSEVRRAQRQAASQFAGPVDESKLPTIVPERIAYHPIIQERFGIDRAAWRALIDAVWPSATTTEGVMLALSYCRAKNYDPFKRPVHIVPIWSSVLRRLVETVWEGIGGLRTTAHRTGQWAGKDRPEWGPTVRSMFRNKQGAEFHLEHPQWCEQTVYKIVQGAPRAFPGPRVYWLETYAREAHDSEWPNSMWRKRVHGQLEKCAEAAALRAAFPEEIGEQYIGDEISPDMRDITPSAAPERPESATSPLAPQVRRQNGPEASESASTPSGHPETAEPTPASQRAATGQQSVSEPETLDTAKPDEPARRGGRRTNREIVEDDRAALLRTLEAADSEETIDRDVYATKEFARLERLDEDAAQEVIARAEERRKELSEPEPETEVMPDSVLGGSSGEGPYKTTAGAEAVTDAPAETYPFVPDGGGQLQNLPADEWMRCYDETLAGFPEGAGLSRARFVGANSTALDAIRERHPKFAS